MQPELEVLQLLLGSPPQVDLELSLLYTVGVLAVLAVEVVPHTIQPILPIMARAGLMVVMASQKAHREQMAVKAKAPRQENLANPVERFMLVEAVDLPIVNGHLVQLLVVTVAKAAAVEVVTLIVIQHPAKQTRVVAVAAV